MRRLEDFFPYDSFRPNQRKLIDFIHSTFVDEKIGLVYAPTGLGKTISVLSAHFLDPEDKLIVLTRTRSQAKIYSRELKKLKKRLPEITYVFLRSKQELCALARKSKRLSKVPYSVFIKICEAFKRRKRCAYYQNSVSGDGYSPRLIDVAMSLLERGATVRRMLRAGIRNRLCPYEIARYLSRISNVVVGTYPYIFDETVRENFLASINSVLSELRIVIDEAHNLPEFILNHHNKKLSTYSLDVAYTQLQKIRGLSENDAVIETLDSALDILYNLLTNLRRRAIQENPRRMREVDISDIFVAIDLRNLETLVDASYLVFNENPYLSALLLRIYDFVDYYLRRYVDALYITTLQATYGPRGQQFIYQINLLDPSEPAMNILQQLKSVVLISGSLHPLEYYRLTLGLNSEPLYYRTEAIIIPNPFPPNNLRVYTDTELSTKYDERTPEMFHKYSERLQIIASEFPKIGGILVIFPSYAILNSINELLGSLPRRVLVEEKKTKLSDVIRFLIKNPDGMIFAVAGGKLAEGIDYRYRGRTLIRMVVIAGLPFPEYNIYLVKRQEYYERRFQDKNLAVFLTTIAPMIRRVLQASGRLIRSEEDKGVVIVLDKRFGRYAGYFPRIPWQLYEPYRGIRQLREILREASRFLRLSQ